jgi:hypothetical protein
LMEKLKRARSKFRLAWGSTGIWTSLEFCWAGDNEHSQGFN